MIKLLFILLLLPCFCQAQTIDSTLQKFVLTMILANKDTSTFPANQVMNKQVGPHLYSPSIIGFDAMVASAATATKASSDVATLTQKLSSSDSTINVLKGLITTLQNRPIADTTLTKRVTVMEQKILAGFTVTGVAK